MRIEQKLAVAVVAWAAVFVWTVSQTAHGCKKDYIDGPAGPCTAYMPRALGATKEELGKWSSDEKAPGKGHQPDWETGAVTTNKMDPVNPADEHHPPSCPIGCKWDGGNCTGPGCPDEAAGKKP